MGNQSLVISVKGILNKWPLRSQIKKLLGPPSGSINSTSSPGCMSAFIASREEVALNGLE